MFHRSFSLLFLGCLSLTGRAQGPTGSTVAPTAVPTPSACDPGFAEIVAKHFYIDNDAKGGLLPEGMLRITARRGWDEDGDRAPVSYRTAGSTKPVEAITVPIHNGALDHAACIPYTQVYGARPTRYQFTVTSAPASTTILTVTADISQPQYLLDDDGLFRTDGDMRPIASSRTDTATVPVGVPLKQ